LHHVDNRAQVFREFTRVVKPQGKIIIVDVEEGSTTADFLNVFVNKHNSRGTKGSLLTLKWFIL
jgi:ubiquinone/menaquinone biosynthesis C-methylase UbiE